MSLSVLWSRLLLNQVTHSRAATSTSESVGVLKGSHRRTDGLGMVVAVAE